MSDFRLEAQESFNLPSKIKTVFNYANLSTFDGTFASKVFYDNISEIMQRIRMICYVWEVWTTTNYYSIHILTKGHFKSAAISTQIELELISKRI